MEPSGPFQPAPITAETVPSRAVPSAAGYYGSPPPRRRTHPLTVLFLLAVLGALGFSVLLNVALIGENAISTADDLEEEYFSPTEFRTGSDKIAIISVEGAILSSAGFVKDQIDQASRDEDVKAVVLRIDSPGGSVAASDYLYHHLSKLRTEAKKPIVVSMGSMAASGGYYVAMAAGPTEKTIFAEPTCFTGSIGVLIPHYNLAGLMEKFGVTEDPVASHPLKTMGSIARDMTAEEKQIFQGLVDESFARFKSIIRDNRKIFAEDPAALDKLATGQVYTAEQAKDAGLVDEVDFIEAAIDRAIELAGLDRDQVQVIRYEETLSLSSLLLGAQSRSKVEGLNLQQLLDATAPKAYYMVTQLPPLVRSGR
ncbi:MAG: signal peptide peptidase SppA [Thermoguttaceae bacterium]